MKSTEVWKHNFRQEVGRMSRILGSSPSTYVAIDTEFPGFLYRTPFNASERRRYGDMQRDVNMAKIIQLGLTFYDDEGVCEGSWQINFREFSPALDPQESAIQLLLDRGMDFDENTRNEVRAALFPTLFYRRVLLPYRHRIKWITFHGLHDMGYMVKMLTGTPLPTKTRRFLCRVENILGRVHDIKYMVWRHGYSQRIGPMKLAERLDAIDCEGRNHQAGFDSLILVSQILRVLQFGSSTTKIPAASAFLDGRGV